MGTIWVWPDKRKRGVAYQRDKIRKGEAHKGVQDRGVVYRGVRMHSEVYSGPQQIQCGYSEDWAMQAQQSNREVAIS